MSRRDSFHSVIDAAYIDGNTNGICVHDRLLDKQEHRIVHPNVSPTFRAIIVYRSMTKVLWVGVLAPKNAVHEGDIISFRDAKFIGPILLGAKFDRVARTADKFDDACHFGKFGRIVLGRTVCDGWTPDKLGNLQKTVSRN